MLDYFSWHDQFCWFQEFGNDTIVIDFLYWSVVFKIEFIAIDKIAIVVKPRNCLNLKFVKPCHVASFAMILSGNDAGEFFDMTNKRNVLGSTKGTKDIIVL